MLRRTSSLQTILTVRACWPLMESFIPQVQKLAEEAVVALARGPASIQARLGGLPEPDGGMGSRVFHFHFLSLGLPF